MSEKITVPTLGESVTEATVSKWLKSQGEKVSADEPLVELETDKVNVEVPAPSSGILGNIKVKEGETVNVGSLLGTIDNASSGKDTISKEENKYNPPKKEREENTPKIFEEQILESKKKLNKIKKTSTNFEDEKPLILNEETLILDQVHQEKSSQNLKKQVSPAARK